MKKLLIAVGAGIVMLSSCKEKDPPINFSDVKAIDSTYVLSSVPAADPHNVLVEEFTGQGCSNCPAAHANLLAEEAQYPGRVNIIGLYIANFSQTTPPAGAKYDFRDSVANAYGDGIYGGINAMPQGGIDRTGIGVDPTILLGRGDWGSAIANRLNVHDSINLSLTSSYNNTTGLASIAATITYLNSTSAQQNLTIAIVEDSMVDKQEFTDSTGNTYVFTNVFRAMVTGNIPAGDPVLQALPSKESGRVYRRYYTYHIPSGWVPAHCKVIAYINNASNNRPILQSVQVKLTGQ